MIKLPVKSTCTLHHLRDGIAKCIIEVVDSDCIVHNNWAMKYSLEETMELISKDDVIHSWMVSIDEIVPEEKSIGGRVGGGLINVPLDVRIWGFIGYEYGSDGSSRTAILEQECLEIIKILYLNEETLGMTDFSCLQDSELLQFDSLTTRSFGSGNDVIIAEGSLKVDWSEIISEQ